VSTSRRASAPSLQRGPATCVRGRGDDRHGHRDGAGAKAAIESKEGSMAGSTTRETTTISIALYVSLEMEAEQREGVEARRVWVSQCHAASQTQQIVSRPAAGTQ
jgi:hypothetical protein